jgi:lysophospholipase L1-like esterase
MLAFVGRVFGFSILTLIVMEGFFRWLLPAADVPRGYQDPEFGIMLHDTTSVRSGFNTRGRWARPAYSWHINNYGANAAEDFKPAEDRERPCIVAIGDSFLQGLYSDVDAHLSACLQQKLDDKVAVYNLGTSGVTLSQYLRVATFARHHFSPDMILLQTSSSSLRNSVRDLKFVRYSAQFVVTDAGLVLGEPTRFTVSRKNRLLRRSALVRYLFFNANINLGAGIVQDADQNRVRDDEKQDRAREEAIMREVLELILTRMKEENPGVPILILLDTDRRAIYETGGEVSPLAVSPIYRDVCARLSVHFVDISERFAREYRANGRRFEFADNSHWNPYGVEIVADEVARYLTSSGLRAQLLSGDRYRD